MPRLLVSLLTALLLACAPLPAAAQKYVPKTIQFQGDPEYTDQELLAASGLKKGMVLAAGEMDEHAKRLMDSGAFHSIAYKFDGQDLVFTLTPSTTLYAVRIGNLPLATGAALDAKLHERFPLYHGKVPSEGGMLEDVRGALEEMLTAEGIHAPVAVMPFGNNGAHEAAALNFSILSPPVRVGAIHLDGVSPAMQASIQAVTSHAAGLPFDTANSAANLEHVFQSFYADEGYAAAKVHAERAGDPAVTEQSVEIPFTVSIQEGRQYKVGWIHLPADATLLTQAELDKEMAPASGTTAKGLTLRTTWSLISARYRSKGYLDCKVTPVPELDETAGVVNYNVRVEPGHVYRLAFVKFENVSDELRIRLMRAWTMLPGDPFDAGYMDGFVQRAQKQDPALARTLAAVKVTYKAQADPVTHEVNCVIRLEKLP
jgi:outer membrane protein assembly factor BamA